MAYRVATIGGLAHVGRTTYDGESRQNPDATFCGIATDRWSMSELRLGNWGHRKPGNVCATCDRTLLWENVRRSATP